MAKNRKRVEDFILKLMKTMDPSEFNVKYYKSLFEKLSDKAFDDWMSRIEKKTTKLYFYAPNMKVFLKMDDLMAAAELTHTEYFQRIKIWDKSTRRYYTTPHSHLILQLPVRRLEQYIDGKMSMPENDRIINPMTGQVTGSDKGSSMSMTEAQTLDSKGLHECLKEFLNVRGGNIDAYNSMRSELEETGRASFTDLTNGGIRSAETTNTLLKAMHLDNNL